MHPARKELQAMFTEASAPVFMAFCRGMARSLGLPAPNSAAIGRPLMIRFAQEASLDKIQLLLDTWKESNRLIVEQCKDIVLIDGVEREAETFMKKYS